jgi:hypothetical protein
VFGLRWFPCSPFGKSEVLFLFLLFRVGCFPPIFWVYMCYKAALWEALFHLFRIGHRSCWGSGRPRTPRIPFQKVGDVAHHLLGGSPGPLVPPRPGLYKRCMPSSPLGLHVSRGCTSGGRFSCFQYRKSFILGVCAEPGAPDTLQKGRGLRPPPFGRSSLPPAPPRPDPYSHTFRSHIGSSISSNNRS